MTTMAGNHFKDCVRCLPTSGQRTPAGPLLWGEPPGFSNFHVQRRENHQMSFVVISMDDSSAVACSEDRAGIGGGPDGTPFVLVPGNHIKSFAVNPQMLFAIVGRVTAANAVKRAVAALGHFSFARLAAIIPAIARAARDQEGAGARLNMSLAGWDAEAQKMRAVIWNIWGDQDDHKQIDVEPKRGGERCYWVLGSSEEAQTMALNLMVGAKVPDAFAGVFAKLSDRFPEIGNVLTVNAVSRPTGGICRVQDLTDGASYVKTPPNQVQYISATTGKVPASTMLNTQGAIVPAVGVPVTVNLSPTSIEVVTTNQTRWFGDGATITVLATDTTFSGLANSTTYYLYMRYNVVTGVISFGHGAGTPPTSPSSQFAANCSFDGFSPLGLLIITTQASGGTGGSGGGSSDTGGCPSGDELVNVQGRGVIAARDVVAGDLILGENLATGEDVWRRVTSVEKRPNSTWRIVDGHRVTQRETIWYNGAWVPAYTVSKEIDVRVGCTCFIAVEAETHDDHNYRLVGGERSLTIHNPILPRS
ncbi:MAG: hypothetical protein LAO78_23790 [Acidobacteriia bacterium]|nr:hypothetical protein [Terriglobia bacterium]